MDRREHKIKGISRTAVRAAFPILALCSIIIASLPWYSDHLSQKSLKQAESGYQAESLHTARMAVTINPLSVNARFVLAGVQQRLGRESEARSTLMEATRIQPENYSVWEQLAVYERERWRQPELAGDHFGIAVSLNPHDAQLRQRAEPVPLSPRP